MDAHLAVEEAELRQMIPHVLARLETAGAFDSPHSGFQALMSALDRVKTVTASLSRLVLSLHRARSARENFGNLLLETRVFVQGRAWTNVPGYGALGRRERIVMRKHGQVALLGGRNQALPGCNESCG